MSRSEFDSLLPGRAFTRRSFVQTTLGSGFAAAVSAAARRSEVVVYPDVPHAFHADYRPSYRQAAADDGWRRCLAWFRQHGVA